MSNLGHLTDGVVTIEVTCTDADEAARIGSSAVSQGLAASANHYSVESSYRWQEEIHHAREEMLRLATTSSVVDALVAHIHAEHSYELPHVRVSPVDVSPAIAAWVEASTVTASAGGVRSRACYMSMKVLDLAAQASFWSAALEGQAADVSVGSTARYAKITVPGSDMRLLLERVDQLPAGGRFHLDIEADDIDAESRRLQELGASLVRSHHENGFRWHVLADPEGNELCVLTPRYPHLLKGRPAH